MKLPKKRNVVLRFTALIFILVCTVPIGMFMFGNYLNVFPNRNRVSTLSTVSNSELRSMWMSRNELNLFLKYLKRGVTNYLEWGSAGSTSISRLHFPRYVTGRYVSIEHVTDIDTKRCDKVKSRLLSLSLSLSKAELRCISVPRGYAEDGNYTHFKKYVDEIAQVSVSVAGTAKSYTYWDFVFLDGIHRVDAGIKALSFIRSNSIVALHDSHRMDAQYSDLHYYYDVVEQVEGARGLAILKRKEEFALFEGRPELVQIVINDRHDV